MFQPIPQTPLKDHPKVTHRGQIIQQKKTDSFTQFYHTIIQRVFEILKRNEHWYEMLDIHNPYDDFTPYPRYWIPYVFESSDGKSLFPEFKLHLPHELSFTEDDKFTVADHLGERSFRAHVASSEFINPTLAIQLPTFFFVFYIRI